MSRLQEQICEWADKNFGQATFEAAIRRTFQEIEEFRQTYIDFLEQDTPELRSKLLKELCDIRICAYRAFEANKGNFDAATICKMAVNFQRKWKLNGDGTAQHIEE